MLSGRTRTAHANLNNPAVYSKGKQSFRRPVVKLKNLKRSRENQLYPSRRTAANHEHQNHQHKSNSTLDLPANVLHEYVPSSPPQAPSRHFHSSSTSALGEVAGGNCLSFLKSTIPSALFGTRFPRESPNPAEKAVNILPVSRNLVEHVSNLIAIGRKPVTVVQRKSRSGSEGNESNTVFRTHKSSGRESRSTSVTRMASRQEDVEGENRAHVLQRDAR